MRVRLIGETAAHDLGPRLWIPVALDFRGKPKAVKQLRAQVALFGIHRAHQDEFRRMMEGDAFPFHPIDAGCRAVEQRIDQMVVEEVDLVDIENAAVGVGQQTRLERPPPISQDGLEVDRSDDAVLRRRHRKVHHPYALGR